MISLWRFQVTDVADKEVKKLEKIFKEGSSVRVRVLGFRRLEGLATGILKVVFTINQCLLFYALFTGELQAYSELLSLNICYSMDIMKYPKMTANFLL